MSRFYPSTQARLLRARERGIRACASDRNPYRWRGSGTPLGLAWDFGRDMADVARTGCEPMYTPIGDRFELTDLSEQFAPLFAELDATLPDAWPQEGAA